MFQKNKVSDVAVACSKIILECQYNLLLINLTVREIRCGDLENTVWQFISINN